MNLVDLQVNGYAGLNFSSMELTSEDVLSVCNSLEAKGTDAILATLITSPLEVYRKNIPLIAEAARSDELRGRLLGIHLEGPFISKEPGFVGAHQPQYTLAPDTSLLRELWDLSQGTIRLLTLAAELPGAEELVHCARELSITVSIGHSDFNEKNLQRMIEAGATGLTHLGNGLPNELPRHDNPILAGLVDNNMTAMFIEDGFHLPDTLIKMILRHKGLSKAIVVSDVSPIGGLEPGEYDFAGSRVVLEATGRIHNPHKNCLAGSGITLAPAVARMISAGLMSQSDATVLASDNPLNFIG